MLDTWGFCALHLLALLVLQSGGSASQIRPDVISIRQSDGASETGGMEIPPGSGMLRVTNAPMYRVIAFAFDRSKNDRIEGLPEWTRSERWNMEVKVAEQDLAAFRRMPFVQQKALLQEVLEERCNLVAHMTRKRVPVYALVAAKNGPKLREASEAEIKSAPEVWDVQSRPGEIRGRAVPLAALLYAMSGAGLERQVVDETGLQARYDFDLRWTPDSVAPRDATVAGEDVPGLFLALREQLGLQLQPRTAEADVLVVDRVERPSPN